MRGASSSGRGARTGSASAERAPQRTRSVEAVRAPATPRASSRERARAGCDARPGTRGRWPSAARAPSTGSPGTSARGLVVPVAVGQVEDAERDERRRAAGRDVAERARRAARSGRSGRRVTTSSGTPRISVRSASGCRVEDERAPVLGALVAGPVGAARPRRARSRRRRRARASRRAPARCSAPGSSCRAPGPRRRAATEAGRAGGQAGSATQRPGRTSGSSPGSTRSGMNARSAGSSSPVAAVAGARSKTRHAALQEADRGPGAPTCGIDVAPTARSVRARGPAAASSMRKTAPR